MRGTNWGEVAKLLKQFDREAANLRVHLEAMGKSARAISVLIRRAGEIPNFDGLAAGKLDAVKKSALIVATVSAVINAAAEKAEE